EAAAKKAAEEKRLAEEAAAKKRAAEAALAAAASKLNPIFAQETTAQGQQQATPQMETLAGNPNDALFAEPAAEAEQPKREMSLFDLLSPKSDATEGPAKRTLADTLGKQMPNVEDKLENHVRAKKVDDLRTIIGINDKFAFMNNLFNSNMRAYNDFVLHLNAINDREEALEYVNIIAQEYKWDETSDDVIRFHKIFDRKF
ncbi:MAG: hypothetical protein MJZ67_06375, partial [Bacteroidales bacterium]|nr:hypothetical protein [Bacteroidales bacterium]